jgi:hypothetical protein
MHPIRLLVPILALGAALAAPAAAQLPGPDRAGLRVVLLTMGQGDAVWEKFGHNALWLVDAEAGIDRVYNYGVFDFDSPGYWGRFVAGNWIYELGVSDIRSTLYAYRWLNRSVLAQELNLSDEQKGRLHAFLETNALPQNREYLYDYFRDNCSTRIRDALDDVLGGSLRAATGGTPSGTTYRWHSERLIAADPVSYTGLAMGLGPAADREIDLWEEMFLPFKVRDRVRDLRVGDAPLVAREWTMVEAEGRAGELPAPPTRAPWFLAAGVLIAAALAALGRAAHASRAARAGYAALAALWLAFAAVGGWVLVFLWAFTSHTIAHRNENLLQLSPLALPLVLLVPFAAYGARRAHRPARDLMLAIAALSVAGFVLQLLPGVDQRNAQVIALALPVNLALAWTVLRMPPPPAVALPAPEPRRRRRAAAARGG